MLKKADHISEMAGLGLFVNVIIVSTIIVVKLDIKILWLILNYFRVFLIRSEILKLKWPTVDIEIKRWGPTQKFSAMKIYACELKELSNCHKVWCSYPIISETWFCKHLICTVRMNANISLSNFYWTKMLQSYTYRMYNKIQTFTKI